MKVPDLTLGNGYQVNNTELHESDFDGDGVVSFRLTAPTSNYDEFYAPTNFAIQTVYGQELLQGTLMPSNWIEPISVTNGK